MADLSQQIANRLEAYFKLYNDKKYDAYMEFYTEDCRLYRPDEETVIGKEAVRASMKQLQMKELPGARLEGVVEALQFSDEYAWVNTHASTLNPDGSMGAKLKDGSVWKKVGGKWCLHRDFFNSRAN